MTNYNDLAIHARTFEIPIPFGDREKIIKIRELPDNKAFQLKDGTYYDLGKMYSKKRFFWLGYSYGELEYIGFINSQSKYVPLGKEEWKNITEIISIELPATAQISFFDKYLSRPILSLIFLISGFYGYRWYKTKKRLLEEHAQEELPSWPPKGIQD